PFDPFPLRVMAARGYAVFLPNFRGSAGYGEEFRRSAVGRPARRAAADVLSGLDALADSGRIDPGRAGVVGWASGAFKVANLLVRSDRFRAAALGAGHSELHAAVGEGDAVVQWRSLYGGLPWEVPERYRAESPLLHASRIETPSLLIHGGADPLVPVDQSRQLHTYLGLLGVPARLVIVPNEGHGIAHPERRHEIGDTVLSWFDQWLRAERSPEVRS
ncbi:MAG: prolyl oligopeptidase family serine peptidase, partial [Gemmatimonadota bacterium]|nr:prolyl oligopeptidase family serine peptidase [Gemmatimonadota bacterium]